mgnify:FL=1
MIIEYKIYDGVGAKRTIQFNSMFASNVYDFAKQSLQFRVMFACNCSTQLAHPYSNP